MIYDENEPSWYTGINQIVLLELYIDSRIHLFIEHTVIYTLFIYLYEFTFKNCTIVYYVTDYNDWVSNR